MKKIELLESDVLNAYKKADQTQKEFIKNFVGKQVDFSQKITDRVKTFEDACNELGLNPCDVLPYKSPKNKREYVINDYTRLDIIVEALQEGWIANWDNNNEYKWRPWFKKEPSGFGFSLSLCDSTLTRTPVGSRLCLPTQELSNYFGKQFIEIHNRLLTNNY